MTSRIIVGDAFETLRTLESDSVQCVVTSPPYWGLRDYGEPGQLGLESTPEEHVTAMTAVFKQVRRVLRPDGVAWVNYGDCYAGGATTPHATLRELSRNVGSWGVREQGTSNTAVSGLKPKDLVGMPWRIAFALQAAGWWLRSDIIWAKPNPMPESVTDRPTKAHEYVFLLTKSARYFYDADAVRERAIRAGDIPGGTLRGKGEYGVKPGWGYGAVPLGRNLRSVWTIATQAFSEAHFATYPEELAARCILAGTSEYGACAACGAPWERVTEKEAMVVRRTHNHPDYLRTRTSGTMVSPPRSHTTGWEPACACGTAERRPCVVLDPFCGSGTTGLVAARYGRSFVGIELNPEYAAMARRRIAPALAQPALLEAG